MSFRPMLRPGQGFKPFLVLRKVSGTTESGRPYTNSKAPQGTFYGMITQADPKEIERHMQLGTPITHTIVQRGTENRAQATDILELREGGKSRFFRVQGEPKDPGELGHFLIYTVEERADLK